jgi:N-acetylglucosaminyl-diphospho-decaprenol L-rhamnosyltransferase
VRVRVLDNASSDGSADMVAASFPDVELVRSDRNLGFAGANNRLVAVSDADHVLLLNPDTVFSEDVVTPLCHVFESDPRIALVGPRLVYPDGTPQPSATVAAATPTGPAPSSTAAIVPATMSVLIETSMMARTRVR